MLLDDVTPPKTEKAIKNRHLGRLMYFVRLSWISKWWTRRELNPRPKAISGQDYMFSSQFDLAADTSMSTLAANQPT